MLRAFAASGLINKAAGVLRMANRQGLHLGRVPFIDTPERDLRLYDEIAAGKLDKTVRSGCSSDVMRLEAHLLRGSDTVWAGSYVDGDLVVAFSGLQEVYDGAVARSALAWVRAMHQERQEQFMNLVRAFQTLGISGFSPNTYVEVARLLANTMERRGLPTIRGAVQRVLDDITLERAEQLRRERHGMNLPVADGSGHTLVLPDGFDRGEQTVTPQYMGD